MVLFRAIACPFVVASVHSVNVATSTAGDPQPVQYPVLNVHVTEPLAARASMNNGLLTQQQTDLLKAVDARLLASEQTLSSAVRAITAKVDVVANLLQTS